MKINRLLMLSILILLITLPIMAGRNSKHAPHRKHYKRSEQPDVIKKHNHHFQQVISVPRMEIAESITFIVCLCVIIGYGLFLESRLDQMSNNP